MMRDWLFRLAGHVPERAWGLARQDDCLLPYYHMVSDEPVPHVSPLYRFRSKAEFEADLEFFLRRRRAISITDFIDAVRTTGAPPPRSFLLTFDDGFREMADVVAPLLQAKGVPGLFFLTTSTLDTFEMCHHQKISVLLAKRASDPSRFPEREILRVLSSHNIVAATADDGLRSIQWQARAVLEQLGALYGVDFSEYARRVQPYLSSVQVRTLLAKGMAIGAHSIDHPLYGSIPASEQLRQTRESMNVLAGRFSLPYRAFAFPHTDRGVSKSFFETLFGDGTLQVSFGTSAPSRDSIPHHFQRFSMERTSLTAKDILARQGLRSLKLRSCGRAHIQRT